MRREVRDRKNVKFNQTSHIWIFEWAVSSVGKLVRDPCSNMYYATWKGFSKILRQKRAGSDFENAHVC